MMKRYFLLFAIISYLSVSCKKDLQSSQHQQNLSADPQSGYGTSVGNIIPETEPAVLTAIRQSIDSNCAGYYQALPARYDSTDTSYPLLVFLHGIGELGDGNSQLENMVRIGLPRMLYQKKLPPEFESEGKHYSFVIIAPQFIQRASPEDVQKVIKFAKSKYRVDASRVYITGLSLGGGSTWEFAASYGSSVAAIAPICGGVTPLPDSGIAEKISASGVPIWAFHNYDDRVVPIWFTTNFVQLINAFNPAVQAKITTWPTGGHDAWSKAYDPSYKEDGKNIYEWMLGYKRRT